MASPQISKQIDFSKGIYANANRFEQPPGTLHSLSNFVYDKDGALQTVDGSLILCSFNGAGPTTNNTPFRFLLRYAQTGFGQRIFGLLPTGTVVGVMNVSGSSWGSADLVPSSSYDLPNAVQAGDALAIALGRGTTPVLAAGQPLASLGAWTNSWSASANVPTWAPNVTVAIGQPVQPTAPNGNIYTAVTISDVLGSITGSTEPSWPTTTGATVTDGMVVWQQSGPIAAPIPPGADFFFYHMGFLWAWGTNVDYSNNLDGPDALRQSDLNNFFSWNPLNATFLGKGDGTLAMGGAVMTLGEAGIAATPQIVLFKDTTSYVVLGALGPTAQVRQVATGVGCVAPGTITFIEELGVVRLSERGVTVFDGQNDSFQQLTAPIRAYLFGGSSDIMPVDWANIRYAKACRVHNPPAYLMACPIVNFSQAKVLVGSINVASGQSSGSFSIPAGLPASTSIYMIPSWVTSIWQTNAPNVGAISWAVDAMPYPNNGTIYWIAAYGGSGTGALTRLFVYHIVLEAWAVVDLPFAISSLAFIPQNPFPAYTICGGTSDGTVRRLFSGDPDWDGVPIIGNFTIPEIGNPATPSYIKQITVNGRAKWSNPCGFTGTSMQYTDRSGLINMENLYIAPYQVPVYLNVDKTVVSGSVRFNTTGPMVIEGLEIAAQPKKFGAYDINRDGGYTTLDPPNGPPSSHGKTVPSSTYAQGRLGVLINATTMTIPIAIAPVTSTYFASISVNWNTTYWIINQTSLAITIGFGTPAPAGATVGYNIIVNSQLNPVVVWAIGAYAVYTTINYTQPVSGTYVPVINTNWNTKAYITNRSSTGFTVAFDTPAPPSGGIMYYILAVNQ